MPRRSSTQSIGYCSPGPVRMFASPDRSETNRGSGRPDCARASVAVRTSMSERAPKMRGELKKTLRVPWESATFVPILLRGMPWSRPQSAHGGHGPPPLLSASSGAPEEAPEEERHEQEEAARRRYPKAPRCRRDAHDGAVRHPAEHGGHTARRRGARRG